MKQILCRILHNFYANRAIFLSFLSFREKRCMHLQFSEIQAFSLWYVDQITCNSAENLRIPASTFRFWKHSDLRNSRNTRKGNRLLDKWQITCPCLELRDRIQSEFDKNWFSDYLHTQIIRWQRRICHRSICPQLIVHSPIDRSWSIPTCITLFSSH